MAPTARAWRTFSERLGEELDRLEQRYDELLSRSTIRNVDLNDPDSGMVFVGFPIWGWGADEDLVAERTNLLADYGDWFDRFRLLHRSPVPEVRARLEETHEAIRRWLERGSGDHSVPSTIEAARTALAARFAEIRSLLALGTRGPSGVLAVPDTNALLRNPDVAAYAEALGGDDYVVTLLTTVISELDELKDRGRAPEVRAAAARAVRRLKGLRDRGDLRAGIKVAGRTTLRAEHREVDARGVLGWLDPAVPDDRIVAAALDLQARHPAAAVVLVTGDLNLQNKAAAVGLAFIEPPSA